jgi:predicted RNA-binding protein with PIN domain
MKILIDGYNLIFAWGWMPGNASTQASSIARKRMIEKLKQLIPFSVRGHFTMVFDVGALTSSQARQSLASGIDQSGFYLRFAHNYPDADSLIEKMIREESTPNQLVVVSTDQRLRTAAERRKAISIRSEDFLDAIVNIVHQIDQGKNQFDSDRVASTSKQQAIEGLAGIDWLTEFGIDPGEFNETRPVEDLKTNAIQDQLDDLVDSKITKQKKRASDDPA